MNQHATEIAARLRKFIIGSIAFDYDMPHTTIGAHKAYCELIADAFTHTAGVVSFQRDEFLAAAGVGIRSMEDLTPAERKQLIKRMTTAS